VQRGNWLVGTNLCRIAHNRRSDGSAERAASVLRPRCCKSAERHQRPRWRRSRRRRLAVTRAAMQAGGAPETLAVVPADRRRRLSWSLDPRRRSSGVNVPLDRDNLPGCVTRLRQRGPFYHCGSRLE
jgi:hypothetical protein